MGAQQRGSRSSHRPDLSQENAEAGAFEIDLDRAIWDAEYRRRALALLRRARATGEMALDRGSQSPKRDHEEG